ncbi:MAG: glutathione peroxidase [Flavisolibacter sp.]
MTSRQKILQFIYPLFTTFQKWKGKQKILENKKQIAPPHSIYSFAVTLNNKKQLPLNQLQGKKILFVNTASDCGYTNQYADLQKLYEINSSHLEIIGFPSNDFKQQEKGSDEEIANFCTLNYGISFLLAKKSSVKKGIEQNEIFKWLTSKNENGWNDQPSTWNFSKFLVNENGMLTHYFDPAISPLAEEVIRAIGKPKS